MVLILAIVVAALFVPWPWNLVVVLCGAIVEVVEVVWGLRLARRWRPRTGPETMVGQWVAEKHDFKPGVFPNNSISGDLNRVGHYTQLMWRNSRAVGCAVAQGGEADFLVCRYSAGGNVIGERPF